MQLDGPWGPIRYERDELGYPTIFAKDLYEATWARGYFHGLDRLAQVQMSMIASRGELMSLVGDKRFARTVDRALRGLGLAHDLNEQARQVKPETRAWLEQYCRGFNVGAAMRGTPTIMRLLGRRVERFTIASLMSVYRMVAFFGLTSMQITSEMIIAELAARGAPRKVFDALLGDAASGIDLESLRGLHVPPEAGLLSGMPLAGSNAFAVSGAQSRSGSAILMGEFHMEVGRFPPVVYASHVAYADGSFYQGLGIPGLAWNSCGRTKELATTCTFGHADNVDFLAERCRGGKVLVGDEWKPLSKRIERVQVRGARDPEEWTFYDSEYGTVLGDAGSPEEVTLPAIRWSGLRDLANDLDVTFDQLSAKTVADGIAIGRRYRMLSLQNVMADSKGDVGEVHNARVDERPAGWTGAYPYPGWKLTARPPAPNEAARPEPTSGMATVSAANHRPPGAKGAAWVTLPEPHARKERIDALLGAARDLDALVRISYDSFDSTAAHLTAAWAELLPGDADSLALVAWAKEQRDRSQLGLFYALHHEATRALLETMLTAREVARILDELGAGMMFQFHLDHVLGLEAPHVLDREGLRDLLAKAWPIAKASPLRQSLPLERRFVDLLTNGKLGGALGLSSKRLVMPGAPGAPFQSRELRIEEEKIAGGPAFHYVTDMSERGGWYHVPGGASEQRRGPGYGKGVDLWESGRFIALGNPKGSPPNLR